MILPEAVTFRKNVINAACLPDTNEVFSGKCTITGWGRLVEDGPRPTYLQEAEVPLVTRTECNEPYKGGKDSLSFQNGHDTLNISHLLI